VDGRKLFGFALLGLIPAYKVGKIALRSGDLERSTQRLLLGFPSLPLERSVPDAANLEFLSS